MKNLAILTILAAFTLTGCSKEAKYDQQSAGGGSAVAERQADPAAQTPAASGAPAASNPAGNTETPAASGYDARPRAEHKKVPPPAPAPPKPAEPSVRTVAVGPGAVLAGTMDEKVSTETDQVGRNFSLTLPDGYTSNGVVVIPA